MLKVKKSNIEHEYVLFINKQLFNKITYLKIHIAGVIANVGFGYTIHLHIYSTIFKL